MLEKLREFSLSLWNPLEGVFNSLYESSNIWVPIILFFVISLLFVYLLHKLLTMMLNIKIDFKNFVSLLIKTIVVTIMIFFISSLGLYLYDKYENHQQKTLKQEHDFSKLLRSI
ncbi:MAG: Unknown protein [uncultured Sulfurovum sp.]|uniref:Uncharacterized protein n=1 Tax=uncultured Sulfurovum sp. TaxID=269237 RepID=A0A6S6T7T6_9BACT|nr:MAG: Unknown protein [uncultured Sulfurovum sp.]